MTNDGKGGLSRRAALATPLVVPLALAPAARADTGDPLDTARQLADEHVARALGLMQARSEYAAHPELRAGAHRALSAMRAGAHSFHVAPRLDRPRFNRQSVWNAHELTWGGPAGDMVYGWCFLDGRKTYRITGTRGTSLFADLQAFDGYFENPRMRMLGTVDLDRIHRSADGSFTIIASPEPQQGNWLRLDRDSPYVAVQLREAFYDWGQEEGASLHVEPLALPPAETEDEATLAQRMIRAGALVEATAGRALTFADSILAGAGGYNRIAPLASRTQQASNAGASPRADYACAIWRLRPDEVLLVEFAMPTARYWSVQLMDLWWCTLDFTTRQSGLNGHQAHVGPDGRVRMAVAFDDPGIVNWLDPARTPVGQCMLRVYDGGFADQPTARVVHRDELATHLPPGTPRISPAERRQSLVRRAAASVARWEGRDSSGCAPAPAIRAR